MTEGQTRNNRGTGARTPVAAYLIAVIWAIELIGIIVQVIHDPHFSVLLALEIAVILLTAALSVMLFLKVRNGTLAIVILSSCVIDLTTLFFVGDELFVNFPLVILHVVLLSFTALFILINTTHGFLHLEDIEHIFSKIFKVLFVIWVVVSTVIFILHMTNCIIASDGNASLIILAVLEFLLDLLILVLWAIAHFDLEVWINEPIE